MVDVLYESESLKIRTAQEDDISDVLALERSVYATPWSEQSFRFELFHDRSLFWVFERQGDLVGYQAGWIVVNSYHLHNLAIVPRFQGQGLANEVLAFLTYYLQRLALRTIELEVRAANIRGLGLYRRSGFNYVGIRRRYYREPVEDAVLMQNLI